LIPSAQAPVIRSEAARSNAQRGEVEGFALGLPMGSLTPPRRPKSAQGIFCLKSAVELSKKAAARPPLLETRNLKLETDYFVPRNISTTLS
jgi:hypothetical protein